MNLKKTIFRVALMGCFHMSCVHTSESLRQMPAEQLVKRVELEVSKIQNVKGQARLKITSPEQKGVLEMLVAARLPDSIHLEVLDGLGRPVRIFVSHAGRFALWDTEQNTFYRGIATQKNLERFLPLYFSPQELVQVLLGAAPRLSGASLKAPPPPLTEAPSKQPLYLSLTTENLSQLLSIRPEDFRVSESQVQGAQNYKLTFSSFMRLSSQKIFPEKRILIVPSSELFLELTYTDYSLNQLLEEKLFILVPPEGIRIVDVEEGIGLDREGS